MTNKLLGKDVWELLAAEYLPWDVYRGPHHCSQPGDWTIDAGAFIGWEHLLDEVYDRTSSEITPETGWVTTSDLSGNVYKWVARKDADILVQSFDDLKLRASLLPQQDIPLSDLHHDHPIFGRADNLVFRAWHDTGHLTYDLGFDHDDELRLYGLQANSLDSNSAKDALFSESVYQLAASVVLGGYPEKQYARRLGPVGKAVRDLLIGLA